MSDSGAAARLVVPEGLLIDETIRARLERRLAVASESVTGVGAEIAELAPGASYRVHTEWMALAHDASSPAAAARAAVRGAVLVRPGVEFEIRAGSVEVDGTVLIDPGAHVHDPHRATGPLEAASDRGRPPFPRRPVVVFLGCEPFAEADWLRRLVNRLVRHDVEARIATPALPMPPDAESAVQLTRACLPVEATIRALEPDVVVTLDRVAAANVDGWCTGNRSTVVVALDLGLPVGMELVSWQIGRAAGRLRARIGRWVDVPSFVALVGRLGAGPHPMPPDARPELLDHRAPVHEHWKRREPAPRHVGCVVLTGALDRAAHVRVDGLVDNLAAEGLSAIVATTAKSAVPPEAREAAFVLLAGVAPAPEIDALIADRFRSGLPTALDVGPGDVQPGPAGDDALRLTPSAAAWGAACGLLVAPAGARFTAGANAGMCAVVLPTLLTRDRAAALRDARLTAPEGLLVIGWRLGAGDRPEYVEAVADGIALTLGEHRDRVEIAGDAGQVPASLRGHERVTIIAGGDIDPDVIARWAVHVWAPALLGGEIVDDARLFEEASTAGVPSIMPAAAAAGIDGYVSSHVLVDHADSAEEWNNALHHLLDDGGVRARRAQEAARRADALNGLASSGAVVSRLMGRAAYAIERGRAAGEVHA
jgi:hypothetical protein